MSKWGMNTLSLYVQRNIKPDEVHICDWDNYL